MNDDQTEPPPSPRFRLELTLTSNTLRDLETELDAYSRGGFLMDSDYEERTTFDTYSGKRHARLTEPNPGMTQERYDEELHVWAKRRHFIRDTEPGDFEPEGGY